MLAVNMQLIHIPLKHTNAANLISFKWVFPFLCIVYLIFVAVEVICCVEV
jgi:hypothetical protein